MDAAPGQEWRIGAVAERAGLTVKALHHYDEIGLLVPSDRSGFGHRRFSTADVGRLRRVGLLRRLGLSLEEIGRTLDDPAGRLARVTTAHLDEVSQRLEHIGRLRDRLARAAARLPADGVAAPTDLFAPIEEMIIVDTALQRRVSLLLYGDIAAAHGATIVHEPIDPALRRARVQRPRPRAPPLVLGLHAPRLTLHVANRSVVSHTPRRV